MRVIDAFEKPVRSVVVSPDGRFLTALTSSEFKVFNWTTAEIIGHVRQSTSQVAFTLAGDMFYSTRLALFRFACPQNLIQPIPGPAGAFAGGIASSPDGKTLVASRAGFQENARLEQWELPACRAKTGFDFWSPFDKLGFSPNGEFLAGINNRRFELRISVTGGQNGRHRLQSEAARSGFFAFPRDSQSVVFGWDAEFRVMETRNGNVQRRVMSPSNRMFLDAAFLGSGRQLATVDGSPVMSVWSADSWEITRGYDWSAGELTCVTSSSDGLAGVCGTQTGKLIVFDVDE